MTIRVKLHGVYPQITEEVVGTTAEIQAYTPSTETATGIATDTGVEYIWASGTWHDGGSTIPVATASVLGGIKQGTGATIEPDGTLNVSPGGYTLPIAAPSTLGGVMVQESGTSGLSIDGSGHVVVTNKSSQPFLSGTLATILATTAAAGTIAQPTDVLGSSLQSNGSTWDGFVGAFATTGALGAYTAGLGKVTATVPGAGGAQLEYSFDGAAWVRNVFNLVSNKTVNNPAMPIQAPHDYYATKTALDAAYPTGLFVGQIVWVANPAVPLGRSRLMWNGSAFVPPAGEVIACQWRGASSILTVTPGAGNIGVVTLAYSSPVIPDCFLLANGKFEFYGSSGNVNASGVTNAMQTLYVSGAALTWAHGNSFLYPLSYVGAGNAAGAGIGGSRQLVSLNNARTGFKHPSSSVLEGVGTSSFVSGGTKVMFNVEASHAGDTFQLDGYQLTCVGNL